MTIKDKAFDYSMKRGVGKKAYENYIAGAKGVLSEIIEADKIGGTDAVIDRLNNMFEELK